MARNIHSHSSGGDASPSKGRAARAKSSDSPTSRGPAKTGDSAIMRRSSSLGPRDSETVLDREAVSRLAYSYWEARGRNGGSPEEDWLRAERELGLESRKN